MGHQTENERSSGEGTVPAVPTVEPAAFEGEDAPYVPRVFAFDPSVKAELRDPEGSGSPVATGPEPAASPTDPAPTPPVAVPSPGGVPPTGSTPSAGDDGAEAPARRSVLTSIRANAAEPPTKSTDTAPTPVADAWHRPDAPPSSRGPAPTEPTTDTPVARSTVAAAPTASSTAGEPDDAAAVDSTAVLPAVVADEATTTAAAKTAGTPVPETGAASVPDATTVLPPAAAATGFPAPGEAPTAHDPDAGTAPPADGPGPGDVPPGSPLDGLVGEEENTRGWVRGLAWTGVGVLVLGGLYAGAQWFYADKVPHDTSVAGVEIGGLTTTAAVAKLNDELGTKAKEPIAVSAGDASATLDPAASGLSFDAKATVDGLTSFSLSPATLWAHIAGGSEEDPVVAVDEAKLKAQVEALTADLEVAPVDGSVQFVDGAPAATPAVAGLTVDADAAPAEIVHGWLRPTTPIALSTTPVEPAITQQTTDEALAVAQSVVSGPVTVSVGGQTAELPPEALAAAAVFTPTDGALALSFNTDLLTQDVVDRTSDLLTVPEDAHFEFVGGTPQIVGGDAGTTLDPTGLNAAVVTAATGADRTAVVELVETDPAQSVQVLQGLGITEKISEFDTPLTNESIRTKNLVLGASRLNGQLVKPGETFSLLAAIGPITAGNGYFNAMTIQSGKHVDGIGGGLSQLSTTLYNASYFAGVDLTEHQPHSRYFTRYPAGREATLFEGQIDNKFTNDTPYGILIQSWVADGRVHVAFWSTTYYTVQTSDSGKSNVVGATVKPDASPDCTPMGAGQAGFSITNYRKVYAPDGSLKKDETWPWTYAPDNGVSCGG